MLRIVRAEDERRWDAADLGALLSERDERVRRRAALAAGRIGDERSVSPLVVLLHEHGGDEVVDGGVVGEDADHIVRRLISRCRRSRGFVDQSLRQCSRGTVLKANRSSRASQSIAATSGNWASRVAVMRANCSATASASGGRRSCG